MDKKKTIKNILIFYAATRIFLIFLMLIDNFILKTKEPNIISIFYLYDGEHYLNIANNGYVKEHLFAFFPLVPLLIRYLGKVGFLLLNQVCVILTAYLLYMIGKKHLKLANPFSPALFYLISPISIMTMLFYTEALFMLLTTFVYYLYKEKKYYFLMGIALGLSSVTRSTGSILFFALFIMMVIDLLKKRIKFKKIIITYIPATLVSIIYPVYLYFKTGNPFKFVEVQKYWLKEHSHIFRIIYDTIVKTIQMPKIMWTINSILTIVLIIMLIKNVIKNRKEKKYHEIFIYFLLTIIMICFSIKGNGDPLTSYYRYIFACFPVYFIIKDKMRNYLLLGFFTINVCSFFLLNSYFF